MTPEQLNLQRLRSRMSEVNTVMVPPMPELPIEVIERFPGMDIWMREMRAWRETLKSELQNKLSAPDRSPQPT